MSWPDQGEYAATTYFVTDDPHAKLRVSRTEFPIVAAAAFTDGIERLALDFTTREPHFPFFDGVFRPLDESPTVGRDMVLSGKLSAFLDSEAVNKRTNDDKTLVLAVLK